MQKKNYVVGLDIGTTKICAMVSERDADGHLKLKGLGLTPSVGLRKGVVINIEDTVNSIGQAVSEAEEAAGVEIESVFAGIAGGHIKSFNFRGAVGTSQTNKEINQWDVERAINAAKAASIPMDRQIIHILPQGFIVDGEKHIKNPVGMVGNRLEVLVHIVTAAVTSAQNIIKCIQQAGLAGGIIITGGTSLLPGLPEMARCIFDSPTRLGCPNGAIRGLEAIPDTPILSTVVGLCLYGFQFREGGLKGKLFSRNLFTKVLDRMCHLLNEYF